MTLLSVPGKVFAWIIIDRVRHHLLEHQRPEQSGFTPKRSTIDCILALWVLTEHRRVSAGAACPLGRLQEPLFAGDCRSHAPTAFVDQCKAFDSVNWDALWSILVLRGVPRKVINLMSELYSGAESAVR